MVFELRLVSILFTIAMLDFVVSVFICSNLSCHFTCFVIMFVSKKIYSKILNRSALLTYNLSHSTAMEIISSSKTKNKKKLSDYVGYVTIHLSLLKSKE